MKNIWIIFILLNAVGYAQQFPILGYGLSNPTFLDSTISKYKMVLTSEIHWNKNNVERQKSMIRYLAKHNSLNKIVLEKSYSFGYWINEFIKKDEADTSLLKELLSYYNLSDYYFLSKEKIKYVDSYHYYLWLHNFVHENKISLSIVGIDLEMFIDSKATIWSFVKYINLSDNAGLKMKFESNLLEAKILLQKEKVRLHDFKKWFNRLEKTIESEKIKSDFIKNYIFNIKQSIPFARGSRMNYREKLILVNFMRYVQPSDKIYGQFGLPHITLSKGKRTALRSFVSVLNQTNEYKGKILSIGLICFNCQLAGFSKIDYYQPFLTKEEFERLTPAFKKLPANTFVDLRNTNEAIKDYVQLLLIVHE